MAQGNLRQRARREPLFDIHPSTGASVEVFYADRGVETFGRCGAGWFWWPRRPGFPRMGNLLVRSPRATQRIAMRSARLSARISRAGPGRG
jgi:hypothetical protein